MGTDNRLTTVHHWCEGWHPNVLSAKARFLLLTRPNSSASMVGMGSHVVSRVSVNRSERVRVHTAR